MLSEIRERKLVQWVVAYVAGSFIVLQGLAAVKEAWPEFAGVLRVAFVLALIGLPVVIVIGWFHGEKGRQRVTIPELLLIAAVVLVGGLLTIRLDVYGTDMETFTFSAADVELDSTRYAVLPFRREAGVADSVNAAVVLHDALARWQGIELVDFFTVREAATRDSILEDTRRDQRVAASVGAGMYMTGNLSRVGSAIRIRADLRETRRGTTLADTVLHIPPGTALSDTSARRMADYLLFRGETVEGDRFGTHSFPAGRAYLEARQALRRWDLAAADSLLGMSLRSDPEFARALLWRAQIQTWAGRRPQSVASMIEGAVARQIELTARERLMADGLLHLARGQYVQACDAYDALRTIDERDFAAWFGIGECHARDDVVVRDPGSPSGWAFRSSYHQAVEAFHRAFQLLPIVYHGIGSRTFEQIGERLKVSTSDVRRGRTLPPEPIPMAARPALVAETLAFIPYPRTDVSAGTPGTRPPTYRAAVERQRRLYNEIAETWAENFPDDPDALKALAHTRELLGDRRALQTLERARRSTDDPHRRLMMATDQVELLVKFGAPRYANARALADTILENAIAMTSAEARRLAVIAALAGHPHRAAEWVRAGAEAWEWDLQVPVAVTGPAKALEAYAAIGGPVDSISAYERRAVAALQNRVPPEDQEAARAALFLRAAALAYPTQPLDGFEQLAERSGSVFPVLRAQAAHARGDATTALTLLDGALKARQKHDIQPTQVSFDVLFPESWLWAVLGDTTQAVVMLDGTLNTLQWTEPGSLVDVPRAASLVRAMALRAELAAATGDRSSAHRWADAVATLWAGADDALQPVVRRMHEILNDEASDSDPTPHSATSEGGTP